MRCLWKFLEKRWKVLLQKVLTTLTNPFCWVIRGQLITLTQKFPHQVNHGKIIIHSKCLCTVWVHRCIHQSPSSCLCDDMFSLSLRIVQEASYCTTRFCVGKETDWWWVETTSSRVFFFLLMFQTAVTRCSPLIDLCLIVAWIQVC